MRRWYEERLGGGDVSVGWKHLQQCLVKTVTVPLNADIWRNPNLGAAQPEDESEGQVIVVSKEHVAHQVREVIAWREKWLAQEGLPRNTFMNNEEKDAFLKASKEEYHSRPDQRERQERDAAIGGKQSVNQRKKSRWARNLQRLAGTTQMWHALSFTGKFDPAFFANLPPPPPQAGEQTERHRLNNKLAVEARAKRRQAIKYARLRHRILRGECAPGTALSSKQQDLLALYDAGTLLAESNRRTRISGNGRVRRSDGSFVDIGGSTGGYTRTVLYDWQAPDVTEFDPDDPGDVSQLADTEGA